MTFKEAQDIMWKKNCMVEFQSLTSTKKHTGLYTVKEKWQSDGDKLLVWHVPTETFHDIEVSTIISITPQ